MKSAIIALALATALNNEPTIEIDVYAIDSTHAWDDGYIMTLDEGLKFNEQGCYTVSFKNDTAIKVQKKDCE